MAEFPNPGNEAHRDIWGDMLNEALLVTHNTDGTLKSAIVQLAMMNTDAKPVFGSKAGSNTVTYTVTLPFTPALVLAIQINGPSLLIWVNGMGALTTERSKGGIDSSSMFVDKAAKTITFVMNQDINKLGKNFHYVAFPADNEITPS